MHFGVVLIESVSPVNELLMDNLSDRSGGISNGAESPGDSLHDLLWRLLGPVQVNYQVVEFDCRQSVHYDFECGSLFCNEQNCLPICCQGCDQISNGLALPCPWRTVHDSTLSGSDAGYCTLLA
jgi:hypothetical protein